MPRRDVMMGLAQRALDHFEAGTTDLADAVMGMPVSAYTDPERYQRERQTVFGTLPLGLALSIELPQPGDYKAMTVMETPLLLVRGDDGVCRAFLNVCRHRGARLTGDGCGNTRVFSCPYHAWVYNRVGKLIGRYGAESFGTVDAAERGLAQLSCAERCGIVWVVIERGAALDIDSWLGGFAEELASLELDSWHVFEQRTLPGPGWKVTMDGYLEVYHHNQLHTGTVGQMTVGNLLVLDHWGPHQRLTFGRRSLGELASQPKSDWQPDAHVRLIHSCFPNLSISGILGGHCLVSQIFPGPEPDTTITVQTVLAAHAPTDERSRRACEDFSAMVLKAVRDEDYPVAFDVQAGLASGANQEFLFGRNEAAVQHYHRWVARVVAEGSRWS